MSSERFRNGETIDRYVLLRKLGEGGMGEVWKAAGADGLAVAIKFPHKRLADDAWFRDFARHESAMNISHENIVRKLNTFDYEGLPAIVFEFVEGVDMETEIYGTVQEQEIGTPIELQRAVRLACDVLAGLEAAHKQGLVHRDVKASNILIDRQSDRALVSDFGLVMDVTVRRMTRFGMMGGSVPYMSPEQIRDPRSVDWRSDIYSFGIVLYEMLTGVLPFRKEPHETEEADYLIKNKHRYTPPAPPSAVNRLVPTAVDAIVLKMLEKARENRYQSCLAVSRDLSQAGSPRARRVVMPPPAELPPPPELPPLPLPAGNLENRWNSLLPWALIGCSALIVGISLVVYFR
jgi:serine/threonine-protein kinase